MEIKVYNKIENTENSYDIDKFNSISHLVLDLYDIYEYHEEFILEKTYDQIHIVDKETGEVTFIIMCMYYSKEKFERLCKYFDIYY